jgi:hypothetical protein
MPPVGFHADATEVTDGAASGSVIVKLFDSYCAGSHDALRGLTMSKCGIKRRVGRSLLSVFVAYAIAVQSLLITIAGFSTPADAGVDASAFALCLHDSSGAEKLPAGNPDHSGCTHCIFCFAGAHHALVGAAPILFGRVQIAAVTVSWLGDERSVARLFRYLIANPRGPPVVA